MDPIADMLSAIKNAQAAKLPRLKVPASQIKERIAQILVTEGYLAKVERIETGLPILEITLRYRNELGAIRHLRRLSKPSRRIYKNRTNLPRPLRGLGIAIISTPAGLMTDKQARKQGLGGELICEAW